MKESSFECSKTVIYYTENIFKQNQIAMLCAQMGIQARHLRPEEADAPIGSLAGPAEKFGASVRKSLSGKMNASVRKSPRTKQVNAKTAASLPELMVFAGFSDGELDCFLEAYKMSGIAPVALKAILTPHNFRWSVSALAQELEKEHRAMHILAHKKGEVENEYNSGS